MRGSKPCPPDCGCQKHKNRISPIVRMERARTHNREKYQSLSPAAKWRNVLKRYHGITPSDWLQMREAQNGLCYLCGQPFPENSSKVHIDHDHRCCPRAYSCATCRRGLACAGCNQGIGYFGDDPERMRAVADALERAQAGVDQRRSTRPQQLTLT